MGLEMKPFSINRVIVIIYYKTQGQQNPVMKIFREH